MKTKQNSNSNSKSQQNKTSEMTKHKKTGNKKNRNDSSINVFNVKSEQRMKKEREQRRGTREEFWNSKPP